MRPQPTSSSAQRGVALIMAILIVALATILAVSVTSDGYMDQRRTGMALSIDQAYEAALGGEAEAAEALEIDYQSKAGQDVDGLFEDWARSVVLPIEDYGELRGNLEDLQGRFNLNNLVNSNGTANQVARDQLTTLLESLNIDNRWAGIIGDWIDADNNPDTLAGAEDSIYSLRTPAYLTANRPILHTSELLSLVDGSGKPFGINNYLTLEPFVAALPIGTPLNVCTARGKVLDSLVPLHQEYSSQTGETILAENRKTACFPKVSDVVAALKPYDKDFESKHGHDLAQNSNYFRANILVTLGTTELAMYSVLQRNSGKTQVISRSFGSP